MLSIGRRFRGLVGVAGALGVGLVNPGVAVTAMALPQTVAPAQSSTTDDQSTMLDPETPLAPLPDLGVDWPDLDAEPAEESNAAPATDVAALSHYDYAVEGIDEIADAQFRTRFDALSTLRAHRDEQANAAQIDRRAREDAELLTTLLRGQGYYDARVGSSVTADKNAVVVKLIAEPGPLYRLTKVSLDGVAAAGDKADELRRAFGVKPDDPVDADAIAVGEANLRDQIGQQGFPFAQVGSPEIVIDHATQTATLDLSVTPGGERRFGRVTTPPNRIFNARHIEQIARFRPGDPFDTTAIEDLRRALIQTGIVSSVEIKPVEGREAGTVDVDVKMLPAPVHTIAGELGYGTGEGVRAELSWTHRNLFPPEGALTLRGVAGTQEQTGSVIFRRNNFLGRDRVLTAQVTGSNVQRAAYQATTFSLSGSLERQTTIFFQKAWSWSIGAEFAASDERDVIVSTGAARRRTFYIAALPTSLNYDGSDDLLNPTKGFRLGGRLSPELSLQGAAFGYARVQLDGSLYRALGSRVTLAGRLRLGTIVGAPRDQIAPSRRFYAGGGASVRGYAYQGIGPRDPNNDPIGGRSLTEFSVEARIKAFGNIGVVPFFDAGNIYTSSLPKFTGLQYGAGIGLRYYSSFGPIRVDLGTPLNPQPGDPRIAVYVSLGQAF